MYDKCAWLQVISRT